MGPVLMAKEGQTPPRVLTGSGVLSWKQLLKEAVESQRMCELMKQQETHLKQQVRQQPDL